MSGPKPLKVICAESLVRSVFLLPPDAPREAFDEYVSVTWRDGSAFGEWVDMVVEMGVYDGASEALRVLVGLCKASEPRYPWGDLADLPRHLLAWEVWCFCVARWVRTNDISCIHHLPETSPLDHRHAFAVTGESSKRTDVLYAYMEWTRGMLPRDWLDLLVRPEMWRREVFTAWVMRSRWPSRKTARVLTSALQTASVADNLEAAGVVIDLAERDPDVRDMFWHRVEIEGAYKAAICSYRRSIGA